jgi:hypothetical protein
VTSIGRVKGESAKRSPREACGAHPPPHRFRSLRSDPTPRRTRARHHCIQHDVGDPWGHIGSGDLRSTGCRGAYAPTPQKTHMSLRVLHPGRRTTPRSVVGAISTSAPACCCSKCDIRRLACARCKRVRTEQVPWARPVRATPKTSKTWSRFWLSGSTRPHRPFAAVLVGGGRDLRLKSCGRSHRRLPPR